MKNSMDEDPRHLVKAYFDGLAGKDMSRVPWSPDATLRTPLNPDGGEDVLIRGRSAILAFFAGILPAIKSVQVLRYYTSEGGWIAGQVEISLANGKTLRVLDAFRIGNGEIVEQQNYYDPRPAMG